MGLFALATSFVSPSYGQGSTEKTLFRNFQEDAAKAGIGNDLRKRRWRQK